MKKQYTPFDWRSLTEFPVIGVDEVGRGCLAGPVYAAAVIIDPEKDYSYCTDSKKISQKKREELSKLIHQDHQVSIACASVSEISELNILGASLLAMYRAVTGLAGYVSAHVLVDGNFKIPDLICAKQTTLIKGDLRAEPVGAASIVAKVARDQMISELGQLMPQYQFAKHKGYGTKVHKELIRIHGPSEHHRPTFAGVKEFL